MDDSSNLDKKDNFNKSDPFRPWNNFLAKVCFKFPFHIQSVYSRYSKNEPSLS